MIAAVDAPDGVGGIYEIRHLRTGHRYIGRAVNFRGRLTQHLSALRCGVHVNSKLQAAYDADGIDGMVWSIVETVDQVGGPPGQRFHRHSGAHLSALKARERHYLRTLRPELNLPPGLSPQKCRQRMQERRARQAARYVDKRGRIFPDYTTYLHREALLDAMAKRR